VGRGLAQRIRRCADLCGSGDALAQKAAIPRRSLEDYLTGKAEPKASRIAAIAAAANVSLHWLITGEGPEGVYEWLQWHSARLQDETRHDGVPALTLEQPRAGYVYLPLYEGVSAQAGGGRIVESEHVGRMLAFQEDWIRQELRSAPADLGLMRIEGDSGEPDLRSGDIVLFDRTATTARHEGVYIMRMDDALLVKQLQRLPGGVVRATSRNPNYEPFTIPLTQLESSGEFAIIGRIVWACRRF